MKTKTQVVTAPAVALRRFAVAAAVLLTLCLVFMMPVGAEGTALPGAVAGVITLDSDVTLENDVTLEDEQYIKVSSGITLNLNGHTITGKSHSEYGLLYVGKDGDLTITGSGEIKNTCAPYESGGRTYNGVVIGNYGKLTINGGTFIGGHALYNMNYQGTTTGLAVIEDGVFRTSNEDDTAAILNCGSLEIKKGTISGLDSSSKLVISGGTIKALLVKEPDYPLNPEFGSSTQITSGTIGSLQYVDEVDPHETELNQLTISGGTISNWKGAALSPYYLTGTEILENNYKISITGGAFTVSDDASLKTIINSLADDGDAETRPVIQIDAEEDINIDEQLDIEVPVKIVGVGDTKPTITCSAEKLFRVHADADFENLELVNTASKGRCIDTRVGDITVMIKDCVLTADKAGSNTQPLTIGGSGTSKLTVTLSGTTINAGDDGYGVITFVPVILNILDGSSITGYAALYFKEDREIWNGNTFGGINKQNLAGSTGSTVTVTNSELYGINDHGKPESNSFSTIIFEDNGITLDIKSGTVGYAENKGTASQGIIGFTNYVHNSYTDDLVDDVEYSQFVTDNIVIIRSEVALQCAGDNSYFANLYRNNQITVEKDVISNFQIESKYLDTTGEEKLASVATRINENGVVTEYTVQAVSEETVVPETPKVETLVTTDQTGAVTSTTISKPTGEETSIKKTGDDEVTITQTSNSGSGSSSESTETPVVTIVIKGITDSAFINSNDGTEFNSVTIPANAEITATYAPIEAASDGETEGTEKTQVSLSLKIDNISKPLPVIDASIREEVIEQVDEKSTAPVTILAMITAVGEDKNTNIKGSDEKAIAITFKVPASAVTDKNMLRAYHVVAGNPEALPNPIVSGPEEGFYTITIYGSSFSSYVLVEEEPQTTTGGGSGKDTGSGNYQFYPRDVPANGIVDFGTSKVVKGMELPAGSSGKVTLNTKPTFTMPENGFYAFEIDAPGYNLDAKINGGLSFQIPLADLEAAGWTANDIVLFHGTVAEDGTITWEALPTNLVANENGVASYKAAINGCSPFYIGFVKDGSVVNTEVVDPVTPTTPETPDVPETPGDVLPEIPPVEEPETPASPAPILAVLAGLGAVVALRRK